MRRITGSVTYGIKNIYTPKGCFNATFTPEGTCKPIQLEMAADQSVYFLKTEDCNQGLNGTAVINKAIEGTCFVVNVPDQNLGVCALVASAKCDTITLKSTKSACKGAANLTFVAECGTQICVNIPKQPKCPPLKGKRCCPCPQKCPERCEDADNYEEEDQDQDQEKNPCAGNYTVGAAINVGFEVCIPDCPGPKQECKVPCGVLPQPKFTLVAAGGNMSAAVESAGTRLYVFGDIYKIRSNASLLQNSQVTDLLNGTDASINLPASQLSAFVNANNGNCVSNCGVNCAPFKLDTSQINVSLRFPNNCVGQQPNPCPTNCEVPCATSCNNPTVYDWLQQYQAAADAPQCGTTCKPCDAYVYLNVSGQCVCNPPLIGKVVAITPQSICRAISQNSNPSQAPVCVINADVCSTVAEVDIRGGWDVNGTNYPISSILAFDFNQPGGATVYIKVDPTQFKGIKFTAGGQPSNINFTVDANTQNQVFLLNYGNGPEDPTIRANLSILLLQQCGFPCPQFVNPIPFKVYDTYLQGGDVISFASHGNGPITQTVTPDVTTVFRLPRKISKLLLVVKTFWL